MLCSFILLGGNPGFPEVSFGSFLVFGLLFIPRCVLVVLGYRNTLKNKGKEFECNGCKTEF